MAGLSLKNVTKYYQNGHVAVRDFTLDIADSEFVVLVGPEGCGRSTVLRMIAGLEDISSGELLIDGKRVNEEGTREVAMLFENCVLYPQMSVYENMAFGLRLKRLPEQEIDRAVRAMAEYLNLTGELDALPEQLTEAQRQLAAVGRALVKKPQVFLMDRPFSSRNAKIKEDMQNELIALYKTLKTTSIYATVDPVEAMKMGTKVVVMNEGTIQQAGTPKEIYDTPANRFVAGGLLRASQKGRLHRKRACARHPAGACVCGRQRSERSVQRGVHSPGRGLPDFRGRPSSDAVGGRGNLYDPPFRAHEEDAKR